MLPAGFDYVSPTSVEEAVRELASTEGQAKVIAGGHSLLPMMKLRLAVPDKLVDINRIAELGGFDERDGYLRIGALVRHGDLERSALVAERYPAIADASRVIADPLVRNRGTFCGSLAHGDPAGDWACVAAVLRAELHAIGPDGASVHDARDFQRGYFETALGAADLLVEARIPQPAAGQGSAYLKIERKVGDYAAAAVGAMVVIAGGVVADAEIGLTNVGPQTIVARAAAASLVGKPLDDAAIREAGRLAAEASSPTSDLRGPAEYKRDLVRVLTIRALRASAERAGA